MEITRTNQKTRGNEDARLFIEHGKIPPQAVDLEKSVLGTLLVIEGAIINCADFLKAEMFYKNEHQLIYRAIMTLYEDNAPINLLTVTNQLKNTGELEIVGGPYYVTVLCEKSTAQEMAMEYNARIIVQKWLSREIIRTSSEFIQSAYEDTTDVHDLLDMYAEFAYNTSMSVSRGAIVSLATAAKELSEHSEKIVNGDIVQDGLLSHIIELNKILYGFKAPDVYILAGRPGMGKTALVVSLIMGMAESGIPVGMFSLEMSYIQLTYRMASQKTGISYNNLLRPALLHENDYFLFQKALTEIRGLPIYIDDTSAITINELKTKSKQMKALHGVEMIFIDYLQLMSGKSENRNSNRESQISEISRGIKQVAKDLSVPVMALSQLSREVEKRPDKRPRLSDLRESGSIEQDADVVMFMFRPAYYKVNFDPESDYTEEEMKVLCELEIAKHRNGAIGLVPLRFHTITMRYDDLRSETQFKRTEPSLEGDDVEVPF